MIIKLPDDMNEVVDLLDAVKGMIHQHVGYEEACRDLPLWDCRDYYWRAGTTSVLFAESEQDVGADTSYEEELLVQRRMAGKEHLEKAVFRGEALTLITVDTRTVDTRTDGNKVAMIFDNAKERPRR